ncbi:adhesion G protein-coupled receptor E1-like isoform X1 [Bufo gargarizans]|uniref:adhesion G protein-coupled receptor E1-like isoform X1 n=1 Tax=Bufo gargarizans TaxID=30331 RepID=UPI001CF5DD62|nr:adhesion G protein-coupled receptor E1-like isoform X1 [Bufo gargarizans]
MQTSRRLLFYGLCFFLSFSTVIAIRYFPQKAINFTKCDPALNQCPAHSYCEETTNGYYCACENDFLNDKEKLTITYPGGECLARCKTGQTFPCACIRGYVSKVNENGLYECTDKCKNDSDCPFEASCKSNNCYCNHICLPQQPNCVTLVKLDGVCTEPSTTRSPFFTSNVVDTAVYTQSGSPTPQPAPRSTTTPLMTSSMNMGNTTHYNQLTTSTVEISVTSRSISKKKTEETGATTSQPESSTTRSPFFTSNVVDTAVYTQSGSPTSQPDPRSTTTPLLTSSMNMGNTTHYNQLTTSTVEISVTSRSISKKKTEEPGATTSQPVNYRCQNNSRTEQIERCTKYNNAHPSCTFLKSFMAITEETCKRNSTNRVQNVASEITNLLNQTLKTLDILDLQTVVFPIIENVETALLASFSADPRNQQISTSEIEAEMKVTPDHCGKSSSFNLRVLGNEMQVPCSLTNFENGGAMFILYKGINDKLNGSILASFGNPDHITTEEVISSLVGGAITLSNTENLDPPVTFTLKHMTAVKPLYTLRCVFLDTQNNVWSTHGCESQQSEQANSTRCVCRHLSTFAVIMAPTKIQVDDGLKILSIIGLSISLVCLFLTFLTFILCRPLRSAHTSVLTVLCGCLFLGQLLVLVGLQQTRNKILCSVIAGSLQFLFLCAFCWMSLESILLFMTVRNLQAINYMNSQRSYFPYVCLIGFGIPVIIMIISASLYPDIYGDQTHCWIKISHIWSFLGPVSIFISINFILLVLTFWLLRKKLASLNSNVSTLKHTRLLTFKALSQLFILGCTWLIGLFQFGSGSIVASYIFTICNSLQGLYIFLVHCLLNRQVREEYRKGFHRLWSRTTLSETTASTVQMTMKPTSEASREDHLHILEDKECSD